MWQAACNCHAWSHGKGKEQEEVQQLIQSVDADGNNVALPRKNYAFYLYLDSWNPVKFFFGRGRIPTKTRDLIVFILGRCHVMVLWSFKSVELKVIDFEEFKELVQRIDEKFASLRALDGQEYVKSAYGKFTWHPNKHTN